MHLHPQLVSNENAMIVTDSKLSENDVWKIWPLTLLKLSEPSAIRADIKAIKIMMGKSQRQSQRS